MLGEELDRAVAAMLPRAVDVLVRLVAQPSTVGNEAGAQDVLAGELAAAGFAVSRLAVPEDIGADPDAGVPSRSYAGRYDVVGQRGSGERSLLLNGHIDVVPAEDASRWTSPPFVPTLRGGWLVGRGAGDMKGGSAAGLLALWALDEVAPGWLDGRLSWVSVIEEECTGNGTLAACRAGHTADAALLLEPTDLDVLLGGVAIVWVDVEVEGRSGHAEAALRSVNPIAAALPVIAALGELERAMNEEHVSGSGADEAFAALPHPYNVSIGTFTAGDWPSSVPAVARLRVRVGHPRTWTPEQALEHVRGALARATAADAWLAEHPPRAALSGYRAQRHAQDPDADLVRRLAAAHATAHGSDPALVTIGSTTDARYYLNQLGIPAAAYGPRTRNLHGVDEAVEVASIAATASTVGRFLADWFTRPRDAA